MAAKKFCIHRTMAACTPTGSTRPSTAVGRSKCTTPPKGSIRFATEPIVVDLNNDGKAEVIFASWTQNGSNAPGKLYIVSWDGNLIQSIDLPRDTSDDRGGSLAAPTIANIDADLDLEIVVGTINKGLVAYDIANSARARILWGTGRGSYQRTGLAPAAIYYNSSLMTHTKRSAILDPNQARR